MMTKPTAALTAGRSGSWCQAGTGEEGGGNWFTTTTGGAGLDPSRRILATSSRLSTSFFWPVSANTVVPSVTAATVEETVGAGDDAGSTRNDAGSTGDEVEEEETKTGVEEAAGAEKLDRMPAMDESTLYSTSMIMENLAGKGRKKTDEKTEDTNCLL